MLVRLPNEGKESNIRKAILEFANKYGHLGHNSGMDTLTFAHTNLRIKPGSVDKLELKEHTSFVHESLSDWRWAITRLRIGIDLWEGVTKKKTKLLEKYLHPKGGDVAFLYELPGAGIPNMEWLDPSHQRQFAPGDLFLPAWYALQDLINKELVKGISPQVLWYAKRPTKAPAKPGDPKESPRTIRDVPRNLLAACWLQFAQTFEGDRVHSQCEAPGCKNFFETKSAAGKRTDSKYCSPTCRVRAWRTAKGESK
jgi:hypothetical protein